MTSSPAIRTFRSSQTPVDQTTHHKKPIMKPTIKPLFTLLFLFFATFTFRQLFTGPIIWVTGNFVLGDTHLMNDGFMKFAEVDLGEVSLRQNVEQLVGGDFRTAKRSFLSAGRVGRNVRGNGFLDLRSPEFSKLRLEVRKALQDWFRKRRFSANVMSKMGRKYRSCAVVGNSGILLKSELGGEIDKHEFVIRLNNARIGGFEKFVGSKTGLSFMNSNILHLCSRRGGCFCHPYGENVPIMMYMSQPVHFLDYAVCNSTHKVGLMITDPGLDVLCARIVKYYSVKRFVKETGKSLEEWSGTHGGAEFHYSSGMQAAMFALGVCDKVSIFGFGKSDLAKHHYHTNQKTELSLHDYQAEYDLYEDLVKSPQNVPFISDEFVFPTVVIHR